MYVSRMGTPESLMPITSTPHLLKNSWVRSKLISVPKPPALEPVSSTLLDLREAGAEAVEEQTEVGVADELLLAGHVLHGHVLVDARVDVARAVRHVDHAPVGRPDWRGSFLKMPSSGRDLTDRVRSDQQVGRAADQELDGQVLVDVDGVEAAEELVRAGAAAVEVDEQRSWSCRCGSSSRPASRRGTASPRSPPRSSRCSPCPSGAEARHRRPCHRRRHRRCRRRRPRHRR